MNAPCSRGCWRSWGWSSFLLAPWFALTAKQVGTIYPDVPALSDAGAQAASCVGAGQFLNVTASPPACDACPGTQQVPDATGTSCTCAYGYYRTVNVTTCTSCGGSASSVDRSFCWRCPNASASNSNATGAFCRQACPIGYYIQERDATGAPLDTGLCAPCPAGSYPSIDLTSCLACPDTRMSALYASDTYTCQCPSSQGYDSSPQNGTCVYASTLVTVKASYPISPFAITYRSVLRNGALTTLTVTSDFLATTFYAAYAACADAGDAEACQQLANLCVLQLYLESTPACMAYLKLYGSPTSTSGPLPALYLGTGAGGDASTVVSSIPDVRIDLVGGLNRLAFVLGVYSVNGSFLGMQDLTHQLSLCAKDWSTLSRWSYVGNNVEYACSMNLVDLNAPGQDQLVYDLYLEEDGGTRVLVPVRLANFLSTSTGTLVNAEGGAAVMAGQRLVRRFLLLDQLSSVSSGSQRVLRIATKLTLRITYAQVDGRILLPFLDVEYAERDISSLSASDASELSTPWFSYRTIYHMELEAFWNTTKILFAVVAVVGGLCGLYYGRNWSIRNSKLTEIIDLRFFLITGIILLGTMVTWLFWLVLAVASYWLFFFKSQRGLTLFLPYQEADLSAFRTILVLLLVLGAVNIARLLWAQCKVDVFLMDWEKPRTKGAYHGGLDPSKPNSAHRTPTVSVWRSIFIANQWAQLQTYRRVPPEFLLVGVLFFLQGMGWRRVASWRPTLGDLGGGGEDDALNPVLLFAIDALSWVLVIAIGLVYHSLIRDRFVRNKLHQFVDMLSVSNTSLFVLDELHHGFYLHGCTVHPYADTSMQELNANLRKEATDMLPRRGLQGSGCVSFELIASKPLRETFDKLYKIVVQGDGTATGVGAAGSWSNAASLAKAHAGMVSRQLRGASELHVEAYGVINKFLLSFLDRAVKDYSYAIRDKSMLQYLVEVSPYNSKGTVLYKDDLAFTRTLMAGLEYQLWIAYALLFSLVDMSLNQPVLAAVVVYAVDLVVRTGRQSLGQANLARKTLLDWKFLI